MTPFLYCPPSSAFSQMVSKLTPRCFCNHLSVPDFSPSRCGELFTQLGKRSQQNALQHPDHFDRWTRSSLQLSDNSTPGPRPHRRHAPPSLPPSAARSYIKPRSPTSASFIHSAHTPLLPRRTEDLIYSFHSFGLPHRGRRMKSACLVATQTHFSGAPAFRSDSGIEQSPVTR